MGQASFGTTISLTGSRYRKPAATGPRVLLDAQGGLGLAHFEGGGLPAGFDANLQLSLAGKFTVDLPNSGALSIMLNPSNGFFSGHVKPPGAASAIVFGGAVVTKANAGFGYFLGTTSAGRATLKTR